MGLSFVIPAISIGTSMAYSVVGYDFYMKKRNLDGTNVATEDTVMGVVNNDTESTTDSSSDTPVNPGDDLAFNQDQGSWFGMSRFVTGSSKSATCVKHTLILKLLSTYENEMLLHCTTSASITIHKEQTKLTTHILKPV